VTRARLREYAAVQRERYQQGTPAEKRHLLDEVVTVTGIHRKAAIRLLRRVPRPRPTPGPGGWPREYGPAVAAAAEVLWQASGRIGAHRLQPFVPELLERPVQYGETDRRPRPRVRSDRSSIRRLERSTSPGRGGPGSP
jgi:hypothetical protein